MATVHAARRETWLCQKKRVQCDGRTKRRRAKARTFAGEVDGFSLAVAHGPGRFERAKMKTIGGRSQAASWVVVKGAG